MISRNNVSATPFQGLMASVLPGQPQSWELLDVLPLFLRSPRVSKTSFASPGPHLKLVRVPTYGTIVLENQAKHGPLIVPMHIGFFQAGAQNHATSQVLILRPGETLTVSDAFCIQATQGGLLHEAQQRFIMLPLGIRKAALAQRGQTEFSRLWPSIDDYNRRHGITSGGHLERFLRPYFRHLMRFRHAIELLPEQVGAAYFVAGDLVGVEIGPNTAYWQDVSPILNMYSYGAAALLGERHRLSVQRQAIDLENLGSLNDLALRLVKARQQETDDCIDMVSALANLNWQQTTSEKQGDLHIVDLVQNEWVGQAVQDGNETVYLSIFRDMLV